MLTMSGNKKKGFVKKSISLRLINGGPSKVRGAAKNRKLISRGARLIWHLRVRFHSYAEPTKEQLAIVLIGSPMFGAHATSRTQSLWASSVSSSTHVASCSL